MLLGFRSNKAWKKVISVLYLVSCGITAVGTIFVGRVGKITIQDFLINKVYGVIILLAMIAPYVCLSNTPIRDKLPFFKKHKTSSSALGLTIVISVLMIVSGVVNGLHSDEYLADMASHDYREVSRAEASCEESGVIEYICDYCEMTSSETIDALGHDMREISRKDPTLEEKGEIVSECSRCGEQEVESVDKLPKPAETNDPTETTETDESVETIETAESTESSEYVTESSTGELTELPDVDTGIADVLMDAGYNVEHATEIQYVLNMVGITSIEIYGMSGEAESGLNAMSCYANGSEERSSRFTVTTENGVVFYVGFLDEDLYDTSKGGFLKKYSDVHIPETEVDWDTYYVLQDKAITTVKSCLNYPSTADFDYFSWRVGRSDDNYKISGKVSAKNGFGVEDDLYFSVWFVKEGDLFVVVGVDINGVRVK